MLEHCRQCKNEANNSRLLDQDANECKTKMNQTHEIWMDTADDKEQRNLTDTDDKLVTFDIV